MLERQIMYKQLQELQRRQRLQELGDSRSQDYNQLAPFKQAFGVHFAPTINGTPVRDPQMLVLGNMQTTQHGGSSVLQGLPNGLVQPQPQFDMSLYGNPVPDTDKNLNQYSQLQGPSNHSANILTRNNSSPSGFSTSFMNQQQNLLSDQISMPDGSLVQNQAFQEKILFEQVPVQSSNIETSYGRFASLDPLEQKILYDTDDNSWDLSFSRSSKMGFECTVENPSYMDEFPSIQGGSWSALMQSAVAETSSSDTGIQEEWSGLSFQNPEPSTDNQPSNFVNIEKLQNNWVDSLQNASSPSQKHDRTFNSFPGFQKSEHRYLKQKEEFQSESSHDSGKNHPTGDNELILTSLPSSNTWSANSKHDVHQPSLFSCTNDNQTPNSFSGNKVP